MGKTHDAPGALIATWWRRLSPLPFGRTLFSILIGRIAPYTGTLGARAEELSPGYARWSLRERKGLRNHLNSIHAIALANLAEVTSGTAMLMSLPANVRGIVTGLSIEYLKKARGTVTAVCRCELPSVREDVSFDLHAEVRDSSNDLVARCTVTWLLRPRTDETQAARP